MQFHNQLVHTNNQRNFDIKRGSVSTPFFFCRLNTIFNTIQKNQVESDGFLCNEKIFNSKMNIK